MAKSKEPVQGEFKSAEARITKVNKDKTVEEKVKKVGEDRMFVDPPCNVGVSLGATLGQSIGMPQYESAKLQISLHVPCKHDEIEDTYKFTKEWVDGKVQEIVQELTESNNG